MCVQRICPGCKIPYRDWKYWVSGLCPKCAGIGIYLGDLTPLLKQGVGVRYEPGDDAPESVDKPVDNPSEALISASANVHRFPGAPTPSNQPSQKVIDLLEDLLAQAKAGDVASVGVVWLNGGRSVFTGWESEGQYMTLLGGVTWLQQRMAESDG